MYEEIRRLKHRYVRCVDLKRWDELASILADEVAADYGTHVTAEPLRLAGRDTVLDYLRSALGNDIATSHLLGSHEIHVDGDTATGDWAFQDTVVVPAYHVIIEGAAYYEDRYERAPDGTWRIAYTGYTRLYEYQQSMKGNSGFRLINNRWADSPVSDAEAAS